MLFFTAAAPTYYTINRVGGILSLTPSLAFIICRLLDNVRIAIYVVSQKVKNLPEIQESQVQSLGWEDTLEREMATHSSILAWRIP